MALLLQAHLARVLPGQLQGGPALRQAASSHQQPLHPRLPRPGQHRGQVRRVPGGKGLVLLGTQDTHPATPGCTIVLPLVHGVGEVGPDVYEPHGGQGTRHGPH